MKKAKTTPELTAPPALEPGPALPPAWALPILPPWAQSDCRVWRGVVRPDGSQPVLFRTPDGRGGLYVGGEAVRIGTWDGDALSLADGRVDSNGRPLQ